MMGSHIETRVAIVAGATVSTKPTTQDPLSVTDKDPYSLEWELISPRTSAQKDGRLLV